MFIENLKEAFTSIFCNKMRSVLTMLGIIIGISAVITITTIGNSIKRTLTTTLNSLGGSSVNLYLEAKYPETDEEYETWEYPELTSDDYIKEEYLTELKEKYPDEIKGAVTSESIGFGMFYKNENCYSKVYVEGITPVVIEMNKIEILYGRNISDEDNDNLKHVCIIADTVVESYFEGRNPIGEVITYEGNDGTCFKLTVVGVYKYNATIFGNLDTSVPVKDRSTGVFIPVKTGMKITGNDTTGYSYLDLMINPSADAKQVSAHVTEFFDKKYASNPNWQVYSYNMQEDLGIINVVITVVTVAISFIAAISLIVGGVGVMNIMLVSITERTKEIGVRMAMGAKRKVIRTQFVIEAIMLCLIGGLIGVAIGIFNGYLIGYIAKLVIDNQFSQYASYIILQVKPSVSAILISLIFSMLTGVFFGYYPANKASKMEVIDALRYE